MAQNPQLETPTRAPNLVVQSISTKAPEIIARREDDSDFSIGSSTRKQEIVKEQKPTKQGQQQKAKSFKLSFFEASSSRFLIKHNLRSGSFGTSATHADDYRRTGLTQHICVIEEENQAFTGPWSTPPKRSKWDVIPPWYKTSHERSSNQMYAQHPQI